MMKPIIKHTVYPALLPILFFVAAGTPVEILGCRTRGLLAFSLSLISGLSAIAAAGFALRSRLHSDNDSEKWIISVLILSIPVVSLLILA